MDHRKNNSPSSPQIASDSVPTPPSVFEPHVGIVHITTPQQFRAGNRYDFDVSEGGQGQTTVTSTAFEETDAPSSVSSDGGTSENDESICPQRSSSKRKSSEKLLFRSQTIALLPKKNSSSLIITEHAKSVITPSSIQNIKSKECTSVCHHSWQVVSPPRESKIGKNNDQAKDMKVVRAAFTAREASRRNSFTKSQDNSTHLASQQSLLVPTCGHSPERPCATALPNFHSTSLINGGARQRSDSGKEGHVLAGGLAVPNKLFSNSGTLSKREQPFGGKQAADTQPYLFSKNPTELAKALEEVLPSAAIANQTNVPMVVNMLHSVDRPGQGNERDASRSPIAEQGEVSKGNNKDERKSPGLGTAAVGIEGSGTSSTAAVVGTNSRSSNSRSINSANHNFSEYERSAAGTVATSQPSPSTAIDLSASFETILVSSSLATMVRPGGVRAESGQGLAMPPALTPASPSAITVGSASPPSYTQQVPRPNSHSLSHDSFFDPKYPMLLAPQHPSLLMYGGTAGNGNASSGAGGSVDETTRGLPLLHAGSASSCSSTIGTAMTTYQLANMQTIEYPRVHAVVSPISRTGSPSASIDGLRGGSLGTIMQDPAMRPIRAALAPTVGDRKLGINNVHSTASVAVALATASKNKSPATTDLRVTTRLPTHPSARIAEAAAAAVKHPNEADSKLPEGYRLFPPPERLHSQDEVQHHQPLGNKTSSRDCLNQLDSD